MTTNPFNKPAPPANLPSFGNDFGGDPLDTMMERETAARGKGGAFTPWTPELRIDDSGPVTLVVGYAAGGGADSSGATEFDDSPPAIL